MRPAGAAAAEMTAGARSGPALRSSVGNPVGRGGGLRAYRPPSQVTLPVTHPFPGHSPLLPPIPFSPVSVHEVLLVIAGPAAAFVYHVGTVHRSAIPQVATFEIYAPIVAYFVMVVYVSVLRAVHAKARAEDTAEGVSIINAGNDDGSGAVGSPRYQVRAGKLVHLNRFLLRLLTPPFWLSSPPPPALLQLAIVC